MKWLKIGSHGFHMKITKCLNFYCSKFDSEIRRNPWNGGQARTGWFELRSQLITNRKSHMGFQIVQSNKKSNLLWAQCSSHVSFTNTNLLVYILSAEQNTVIRKFSTLKM